MHGTINEKPCIPAGIKIDLIADKKSQKQESQGAKGGNPAAVVLAEIPDGSTKPMINTKKQACEPYATQPQKYLGQDRQLMFGFPDESDLVTEEKFSDKDSNYDKKEYPSDQQKQKTPKGMFFIMFFCCLLLLQDLSPLGKCF
jgi:hypothetical protein